jgi:hypothetical protein
MAAFQTVHAKNAEDPSSNTFMFGFVKSYPATVLAPDHHVTPCQQGIVTLCTNFDKPVKIGIGHAYGSTKELEEKNEIQTRSKTAKALAPP